MGTNINRKLKFGIEKIKYGKEQIAFWFRIERRNEELYLNIALYRWQFFIGFMYEPIVIKVLVEEKED